MSKRRVDYAGDEWFARRKEQMRKDRERQKEKNEQRKQALAEKHGWEILAHGEPASATISVRVFAPKIRFRAPAKSGKSDNFMHYDFGRLQDAVRACRHHLIDLAREHGYHRIREDARTPINWHDIYHRKDRVG